MLRPSKHPYLTAWLVWLACSTALTMAFLPRMRRAWETSGAEELAASWKRTSATAGMRNVQVRFRSPSGDLAPYSQWQRRLGGGRIHDTLEALTAGPDVANVRKGAAAVLPAGTSLLGCTLSDGVLFADFSDELLDSGDLDLAVRAITGTVEDVGGVDRVVVLVEGVPLSELR